jgi:predicted NUDIX family NTP pyrophosphohydrolase
MPRQSAGLLVYRIRDGIEVLLVHPGGPFWAKKGDGVWTIPKGEFAEDECGNKEEPLDAAKREFHEETGLTASGNFRALRPIKQAGGKIVHAWAVECDLNIDAIKSNAFSLEWPPRSGRTREFPEIDRAAWFPIEVARRKILKSQLPLLDQLAELGPRPPDTV